MGTTAHALQVSFDDTPDPYPELCIHTIQVFMVNIWFVIVLRSITAQCYHSAYSEQTTCVLKQHNDIIVLIRTKPPVYYNSIMIS